MSIFAGLNTAVTGLNAAQVGVNTTSHNISNAENKNYTRQRVAQETNAPAAIGNSLMGMGTSIASITRVHSEFVYTRYQQSSERVAYSSTLEQNLEEIASFFPDMEGVGIKNDLETYYRSWSSLAQDPSSVAQKEILSASAENLVVGIKGAYQKIDTLHNHLNGELQTSIDEVNRIIKDIARINTDLTRMEADGSVANDLRDKRDGLETTLSRLVGAEFVHGNISESGDDPSSIEAEGIYSVIIGGVALVSGSTYHELTLDNAKSKDAFYTIKYKNRDGSFVDMSQVIDKGKVGAILDLRGDRFDENSDPANGLIPDFKERLNMFARGIIEHTNSIYAESASKYLKSNPLGDVKATDNVIEKFGTYEGSFNIVIYDRDGNEVGKRVINIEPETTFNSQYDEQSLMAQLQRVYDDNGDNSLLNDFASQFDVSVSNDKLIIKQKNEELGYTFGIEDNGTNFAGSLGLRRFFDGTDASNISLAVDVKQNPHNITPNKTPADGDNGVADSMIRLQSENWKFNSDRFGVVEDTIMGIYNDLTLDVSSKTEAINLRKETIDVQFTAIEDQLQKISKVSIDTELVNLMKYQTAYSASGKVITTLDRMIDTLLGMKQ
jgi:flagellar hook-associated protein 1 FlgK